MRNIMIAALCTAALVPTQAMASDIIVTARKVQEDVNTVPVTVRVTTQEQLEQQGIREITDLPGIGQRNVPTNSDGLVFSLRGQTQNDVSITVDPSVGIYVDGNYIGRGYGINSTLLDVKDVQILSGPQGTLFGRNTTGGAVLIKTNDPQTTNYSEQVSLSYGRFDEWAASGVVNTPLSDTVAVRVAGMYTKSDGYTVDRITGERYNKKNAYHVRGKVLYQPSKDSSTVLGVEFYENKGNNNPRVMTYGYGALSAFATVPSDTVALNSGLKDRTKTQAVTLNTVRGKFAVNAGWRKVDVSYAGDFDGTVRTIYNLENNVSIEQYSAEALYQDKLGSLSYTLGGFVFNEKGDEFGFASYYGGMNNTVQGGSVDNTSYGAFVNSSLALTDKLTLNGGLRFTHDDKSIVTRNQVTSATKTTLACLSFETTVAKGCVLNQSANFNKLSWTAGIDYKVDDTLVYAKVSTGYKSGGNQIRAVSTNNDRITFNPENITEYELGVKSKLSSLTYRVAGFYNTTTDMQVLTVVTSPFIYTLVVNAAKARSYGIDADASLQLTPALKVDGSLTWTNPKYLKYVDPVSGADLSSNRFNNVTKLQFNVGGTYIIDNFTISTNYVWKSKTDKASTPLSTLVSRYGQEQGNKIYNTTVVPSHGILNARASVDTRYGEVSVWGRNITNTRIQTDMVPLEGMFNTSSLNEPATYGVTYTARF